MRALAAALGHLVATLLLVASVIAPAHCLGRGLIAHDQPAELCLADAAFERAAVPDTGGGDGGVHHGGICLACAFASLAIPAAPAVAAVEPPVWHAVTRALPAARAPPPILQATPLQPRAPPAA